MRSCSQRKYGSRRISNSALAQIEFRIQPPPPAIALSTVAHKHLADVWIFHKLKLLKTSKTSRTECAANPLKAVLHFLLSLLEQFDCRWQFPSATIPSQRWAPHPITNESMCRSEPGLTASKQHFTIHFVNEIEGKTRPQPSSTKCRTGVLGLWPVWIRGATPSRGKPGETLALPLLS